MKHFIKSAFFSVINSYTQVFFSNSLFLGTILIVVSFFDYFAGVSGLFCIVVTNITAWLLGFNRYSIKAGLYGFNSLLVGLGIGITYEPAVSVFVLLFFASLLALFFTVTLEGILGKYGLPFLSLPFLLCIWIVILATRDYTTLPLSERGIFMWNDMQKMGGNVLLSLFHWFNNLDLPKAITIYFRSLGAIFFQYYLFAGLLIAIGLLVFSRLSFVLSLLGFFSGYFYYNLIGADITELTYSYIGFNFILTTIALGGFFLIPSGYSILWTLLLVPLVAVFNTATTHLFAVYQLPIYSLPFNLVVILFLYVLKLRYFNVTKPQLTLQQTYSPEKNLYLYLNNRQRYGKTASLPIRLPFWGQWLVSQGHNGEITHKDDYRFAWDFVITDEYKKTYNGLGNRREDFYCYNKPVLCPADGWIQEIVDGVDDNEIGDVNTLYNWGNTVVIRHSPYLYSKISHIRKESFLYKTGDFVKRGDILAYCGNSGRSPEPHIHFQLQSAPYISSTTIRYPIAHYILHKDNTFEYKAFDYPEKDQIVSNVEITPMLAKAFHFIPGKKLKVRVSKAQKEFEEIWEIHTDSLNRSYFYNAATDSVAWFYNDGEVFMFTDYKGSRKTALFDFYLAAYKVLLGFYKGIVIEDELPLTIARRTPLLFLHDFIAPVKSFIRLAFSIQYEFIDDSLNPNIILLKSNNSVILLNKNYNNISSEITIKNGQLEKITLERTKMKTEINFV